MTRTALLALEVLALLAARAAPRNEVVPVSAAPAAGGPAQGSTAAAPAFPRTVTDRGGQPITIPARPERIVSLAPGMTEVLFAIGAGPRIVATDLYSDYPDAARRTEKLDYTRPSSEQVLALRPDLVLMSSRQRDQVQRFRDLGLPVLFLGEPESLAQAFENMRTIGIAAGEDEATGVLVRGLQARVDAVAAQSAGVASRPRVFYELTPALHTAGPASFVGSLFTILRAQNIAPATPAYPQLTAERVIAAECVAPRRDRDDDRDRDRDHDIGDDDGDGNVQLCTYVITDNASNATTLVLRVKQGRARVTASEVSIQYGFGPVIALPANRVVYDWSSDANHVLTRLNQSVSYGKGRQQVEITARFNAGRSDVTVVRADLPGRDNDVRKTIDGLDLLSLATNAGALSPEY